MDTLLITSKKKKDTRLLVELAKKLGMHSWSLSKEEISDWMLAKEIETGFELKMAAAKKFLKH